MATVGAINTRVNDADSTTNWANDGGGGGVAAEPDIYYQGSGSQSRKVSTTTLGRAYQPGTTTDLTAVGRETAIFKVLATNFSALELRTAPGMTIKIGDQTASYYEFYVAGSDTYPPRGGFLFFFINPSVAGYRDATVATPELNIVDWWVLSADFTAGAKSENLVIDAIDVGLGLFINGGTPAGVFQDFVNYDQGTVGNRFGYVYTEGSIPYFTGQLAIGENAAKAAVATTFTDSGKVIIWNNNYVATGYNVFRLNLGNASTAISILNTTFTSLGEVNNSLGLGYTTTEDTRTILEVTGTSGTLDLSGCSFSNFATFDLNGSTTFENCIVRNSAAIDLNGANTSMVGTQVLASTVAADSSALIWNSATDPETYLDGLVFTQGVNAHHAIEFGLTSPLSITLTNLSVTGFTATNALNNSTFYVARTTGTVTINIIGGTGNFSYKTAGATVNIVIDPVTTQATVRDEDNALLSDAIILLAAADATGELPYKEAFTSITRSGSTATVTHTAHGLLTDDYVLIKGVLQKEYNGVHQVIVTGVNSYTYTVSGTPTTPAESTATTKIKTVVADIITNIWVSSGGGEHYEDIDDLVLDTLDNNNVTLDADSSEISYQLGDFTGGSFNTSSNATLSVEYESTGAGGVFTFQLREGYESPGNQGTLIWSTSKGCNICDIAEDIAIPFANWANITDFSNLQVIVIGAESGVSSTVLSIHSLNLTFPLNSTFSATGLALYGTTTGTGIVSKTRTYLTDQNVTGYIRKSSASPYYKQADISGTIDSGTGLSINVKMVPDE